MFRRNLNLIAALGLAFLAGTGMAQTKQVDPAELKAAFVLNFAQFCEWPDAKLPTNATPVRLGVVGSADMVAILQRVAAAKKVNGRDVEVISIDDPAAITLVHVLYLAEHPARTNEYVTTSFEHAVLTVSDCPQFMPEGGIIRLFMEDRKMRFEIHPRSADRARLRLSSKLLRLAKIYDERR